MPNANPLAGRQSPSTMERYLANMRNKSAFLVKFLKARLWQKQSGVLCPGENSPKPPKSGLFLRNGRLQFRHSHSCALSGALRQENTHQTVSTIGWVHYFHAALVGLNDLAGHRQAQAQANGACGEK